MVKVLDFGLAKVVAGNDSSPDLTHAPVRTAGGSHDAAVIGTAAYMSPEQASGKAVDRRTDTWAFGVVLFEMLTGARPFSGETVTETIASVLKTDPNWSAIPDSIPPELRRLLRRCLVKDPRRRLQSIAEARVQIEDLLAGGAGEPEDVAVPQVSESSCARRALEPAQADRGVERRGRSCAGGGDVVRGRPQSSTSSACARPVSFGAATIRRVARDGGSARDLARWSPPGVRRLRHKRIAPPLRSRARLGGDAAGTGQHRGRIAAVLVAQW